MTLSVQDYDRLELNARRRLGNRTQAAFTPATFQACNYPTRIEHEDELLRFVDTMHEYSAEQYYGADYLLSEDEAELIRQITDETRALSIALFGRPIRPWIAPIDAISIFRTLNAWAQTIGKRELAIMEIGPGSGYLGALLYKAGHRHLSMDNTQSFYLWQNRLYSHLAGSSFLDLAETHRP